MSKKDRENVVQEITIRICGDEVDIQSAGKETGSEEKIKSDKQSEQMPTSEWIEGLLLGLLACSRNISAIITSSIKLIVLFFVLWFILCGMFCN
jgi:hypothetical protein